MMQAELLNVILYFGYKSKIGIESLDYYESRNNE